MTKREEAMEVLDQLRTCVPRDFFTRLDELHKGTGFLLAYLDMAEGEVCAGDIAKEMNVSTARIAVILKKMENSGFILRQTAADDARKTVVTLTKLGRAWIQKTKDQMLNRVELLLERVDKEDVWEFIRLSQKIKAAMDE